MRRGALIAVEILLLACLLATALTYATVYIARYLDDVAYHIPGAVRIAQHANPYYVDSPVDSHWYPAGAEAFLALLVAATGSINATNASGALCFAVLCLLVYRAGGLWTRDVPARLASTLCAASIPLLLAQCLAFYVDIHVVAIAFASLLLQASSFVRREAQRAWSALALAALLPSVKYGGLVYLAVLACGSSFCAWRAAAPRRPRAWAALALVAALLFTGGFYARNWLARGNPVYPIALPGWLRAVAELSPAPYEADETLLGAVETSRQSARFPHPWVPRSWTAVALRPDMTDDGFGAAGTLALAGGLVALVAAWRLDPARRGAWWLMAIQAAAIVALFPTHATGPRYVLILPVVASLGAAVLTAAAGGARSPRLLARGFQVLLVAASATFVGVNLLGDGPEWTRLRQAAARLYPYRPHGLRAIGYAQAGNLRIGYTSGFGNMIALLYDRGLTNELVPLHFRNYVLNHGAELASEEEFVAHVRGLDLDYIQIFDPRYPGARLLQKAFPEKVWLFDQVRGGAYPATP